MLVAAFGAALLREVDGDGTGLPASGPMNAGSGRAHPWPSVPRADAAAGG